MLNHVAESVKTSVDLHQDAVYQLSAQVDKCHTEEVELIRNQNKTVIELFEKLTKGAQRKRKKNSEEQDKKRCKLHWRIETPGYLEHKKDEIVKAMKNAIEIVKIGTSHEIEDIHEGSITIDTLLPMSILKDKNIFISPFENFLEEMVSVCGIDPNIPLVVKVQITLSDLDQGSVKYSIEEVKHTSMTDKAVQAVPTMLDRSTGLSKLEIKEVSDSTKRHEDEDVEKLKLLLKPYEEIPSQDLKSAEVGESLFILMKKYGLLSFTKTDVLIEVLIHANLKPCATLIETFNQPNKEALSTLNQQKNEASSIPKEGPCNIKEDMVVEYFMETSKLKEIEEKMATTKFIALSVIATTWNQAFWDETNIVAVNGFTEDEAIEFLKRNNELTAEEVENCKELSKYLSCLPLAMYGVKTRMVSHGLTPTGFLKRFKGSKSTILMDKMFSDSENRKLNEVLTEFLNILKKDEVEEVFDMVLILQFLSKEGSEDQALNLESFIESIQKFSFGYIRGEGDDRYMCTHVAVTRTIDCYTSNEDKVRLLKNVLKALMWLLDKDNIHEKDYKRNHDLLPHAILVIRHYEILKKEVPKLSKDFELNILVAYVYDLVGYTYNFFDMLKNAGEHSTAAKRSCFAIVGIEEDQIEELVSKTCVRDENYETWEKFAKREAEIVFEKLKNVISVPANMELLKKMALDYNLNTYRSREHIELLQDHVDYKTARNFAHALFLAKEFGVKVAEECKKLDLPDVLYVMLTELNGTLEQIFDDRAKLGLKTVQHLDNAASRFKDLQESTASYFSFGVIKSGHESLQHRKICLKRLVRCYTAMAHLIPDENEEMKKEIGEKLHQCNAQLEKLSSEYSHRQTGVDLRMGECFFVLKKFEEAKEKFLKVAPEGILQDTFDLKKSELTFHELFAVKGLINVFKRSGQKKKHRN
ncbi:unnamed protein product [Mytilus edulis]|uniref:Uncharacterized protein n=1 Tax=Mytilus edulis TaxID=6550 RepID=A0A8S3RJE5_MYTED|nr:unnamed protein product [Mytilus edulis]